jgi:hypothetical protein
MVHTILDLRNVLHKQVRELFEKKDAAIDEIDKLEIQSQINSIYTKIENLELVEDF